MCDLCGWALIIFLDHYIYKTAKCNLFSDFSRGVWDVRGLAGAEGGGGRAVRGEEVGAGCEGMAEHCEGQDGGR